MKKIIFLCFSLIIVLSIVNAYYPGENISVEHNLATDQLVYTIIDNASEVTLPIININSTHINILFPTSMPPQSYKIIFLEETTNEVIVEVPVSSGGGGGTRIKYVEKEVIKEVPIFNCSVDDSVGIDNTTLYVDGGELEEGINYTKLNWITFFAILAFLIIGFIIIKRKYSSENKEDIAERRKNEYE